MCGFVGFIDKNEYVSESKNEIIRKMADKIIHRGPDGEGFFCDEKAALGFRRLSIIDLEGSDQPIFNEDNTLLIIFNGEIYNFKELKQDLQQKGHIFKTHGDGETILHGFEEYGNEIAGKLRGMFSFVIYNLKNGKLYGARDYFGIKPFYYYKNAEIFIFGSEIKSFLPHPKFNKKLNKDALKMYLIFQYSVLEETFFKDVFKLNQGCYFTYEDKKLEITRYFDINYSKDSPEKTFEEYVDLIDETIASSVEYHKISDVEVGSFLSGGVDSSFIASRAKPDKTFSVGFAKDGFDESMYAKELSDVLNIKNFKKIVSGDDFFAALPAVQYHSDEPHANLSAVPLYYLSKMAAEQVKVVLSGEGADELFAGYSTFAETKFATKYSQLPFGLRKCLRIIAQKLPNFKGRNTIIKFGKKVEDYYIGQAFIMDDNEANSILNEKYKNNMTFKDVTRPYFEKVSNSSDLIKKLYLDLFLWLPNDILLKADKMTMAHSLELRVPFLDKEIFKLASRIPEKYLVKNTTTKYIFREAANKIIPEEWAKREKLGFLVPFRFWLKESRYCDFLKQIFNEEFVSEFFEREQLLKLLDEHFTGAKNNGRKLYTIYAFLLWYKQYFGR